MALRLFLLLCCLAGFADRAGAQLRIGQQPAPGAVCLARPDGGAADIYVDPADIQPASIAAHLLADDVQRVTGKTPRVLGRSEQLGSDAILVGTMGHSGVIDRLIADHKIDIGELAGKWESFVLAVVADPMPNVKHALVIVGSDRRGTAYGVFTLSRQIGVSPWYWWANVPIVPQPALYVLGGSDRQGPPGVKYRGIFLNDEAPAMSGWARERFGTRADPNGFNHAMYTHVFELLLRLRANYLWPAMWGEAFNEDDPENPKLANDYGIVMGTSHQEPMLRAQAEFDRRYPASDWNYATHPELMQKFWREGIKRNRNYESIITIGMRGRNDTPMIEGATIQQSMDLLEEIVAVQRQILTQEMGRPADRIPQMWCLYKEVQSYYEHGLRVPDDVTLLWSDDNWGNLRRLPTAEERKRPGGAGIYYHFDYVGAPRNYKWINTNPIQKVWEQMNLAYSYGADRIWIVNVGDLKPMEFPIDFFLTMAWNPPAMTPQAMHEFGVQWATEQFGPAHAAQIAALIDWYAKTNGRRKPELLNTDPNGIYSVENYHEADDEYADCQSAIDKAEALANEIPPQQQDAYFQLVQHPVEATAVVNQLYIAASKNHFYAARHQLVANDWASGARQLFQTDADLSNRYNHRIAGGFWNHMMDQTHLGYHSWQEPKTNTLPPLVQVTAAEAASTPQTAPPVASSASPPPAVTSTGSRFVETDGYVCMDADHFTGNAAGTPGQWERIDGYGRADGQMTTLPVAEESGSLFVPPDRMMAASGLPAPVLSYAMTLRDSGPVAVTVDTAPSLNFVPGRGLRYAIAFDGQKPKVVDILASNTQHDWEEAVKDNVRHSRSSWTIDQPGQHTLHIWRVDPGVVLQKIVVDFGGVKPSYLGPPESPRE